MNDLRNQDQPQTAPEPQASASCSKSKWPIFTAFLAGTTFVIGLDRFHNHSFVWAVIDLLASVILIIKALYKQKDA